MRGYYKDKLIWDSIIKYDDLTMKPSINSITLEGNKSSFDLNMYTIPQVDALLDANRAVRVVSFLPSPTVANTLYYVGPSSEGNYYTWLTDSANQLIDLGWAIAPKYIGSEGVDIAVGPTGDYVVSAKVDNATIFINSEGQLWADPLIAGDAIRIEKDSEGRSIISVIVDSETIRIDSEGRLYADALPKPFIPSTFLHISSEGEPEWVESKINGVDLAGDHNTEEIKVTWYGSEGQYNAITDKYPYTLYIINNGEGTVTETDYNILFHKPSINGVPLVGDKTAADLDMYTIGQVNNLIASVRTIRRTETLPPKADRLPNALYYTGTDLPYDVYLIDSDKNETYLGTSAVRGYEGKKPITIDKNNYVSLLYDDITVKLNVDGEVYVPEMIGATNTADGEKGLVPAPEAGDQEKFLRADGKWTLPELDYLVGEIKMWTSNTIPSGWLLCDGSSYSTTEYSTLYAVIGNTFGGSGGTFNVPNLVGKFPEGANSAVAGHELGSTVSAGLPNVTGLVRGFGNAYNVTYGLFFGDTTVSGAFTKSGSGTTAAFTGAGNVTSYDNLNFDASKSSAAGAANVYGNSDTVQPASVCINYIIRY